MSVDEFKSLVTQKSGIARSNLFRVKLPALPGASSREVNLLCKNVTLPGRQVITNERRIGTKTEKIPYGYLVDDVTMTFHCLNDYGIKNYFETWQKRAMNQDTYEIGYQRGPGGYGFNIQIEQLEKGVGNLPFFSTNIGFVNFTGSFFGDEKPVYTCTLLNAFPTTMNAIQLNNEQDGLVELNVQLSYTDWKPGVVSSSNTNVSTANNQFNIGVELLNRTINLPLGKFGPINLNANLNLPRSVTNAIGLFNIFRAFT
jgi:hypothetical protein